MAMPKSVTKLSKNGVEFTSNVDRAAHTLKELTKAALRDTGKYLVKEARRKARKRTGKGRYAIQYWVRGKEGDLQVGYKSTHRGFPLSFYELGVNNLPKDATISSTVEGNIGMIREIQGKYLSAIEDENRATAMMNEGEELGGESD